MDVSFIQVRKKQTEHGALRTETSNPPDASEDSSTSHMITMNKAPLKVDLPPTPGTPAGNAQSVNSSDGLRARRKSVTIERTASGKEKRPSGKEKRPSGLKASSFKIPNTPTKGGKEVWTLGKNFIPLEFETFIELLAALGCSTFFVLDI